ncbi:MAG: hypothetical protein ABEJ72_06815, partial [Candidatus Aenigmatarchaeota archaeon]
MKLSGQAIQVLEKLKNSNSRTVEDFEKDGFDQSMVNRAALELQEKDLVEVEEEEEFEYELTEEGQEVLNHGSPEYQLVRLLRDGPRPISDLQDELDLDVALGKARQKNWVEIDQGDVSLTEEGETVDEDPVQDRLNREDYNEKDEDRGLVETCTRKTRRLNITGKGKEVDLGDIEEEFNVEARTKTPRTGKRHFYKNILNFARDKWVEMGFEEMSGDFVVPSLMNFDALYTPQDHPARELHDTFFLNYPEKADLSEYGEKVRQIKETHENGWTTGSDGWNYDWLEEDAAKNVLRTHTTAVSAKKLVELEEEDLPKKFFTISRNFRNETVDRHHLAEFLQTDGIVVGKDLNFRHLKAYISEFFEKMGYSEFRLIPSYYPY